MSNSNVSKFLQEINNRKSKIDPATYQPDFKIGDIIVNDKFKVISKVHNIGMKFADIREPIRGLAVDREKIKTPHYILIDFENKAAEEYFGKSGMHLDKKTRQRWKKCVNIDKTYKLLDPAKALILFGETR